ncbi:hypothetical protein GALL_452500 [mine drainage metagenome]|uniref:Uncharacterized protein n=1 Tax=mine drainage metagenome TaxID=410659 RepID=A0A1J5PNG9_9ZZZZ
MNKLFVGNFPEHFDRQGVVGRFSQLRVHLGGFILGGHHETYGPDEFMGTELFAVSQT